MSMENQASNGTELEQLKRRFDEWRQHRKKGTRVPKELWESAIKLSSKHTVSELSRVLRLQYPNLKRRVEALRHNSKERKKAEQPTFVEVSSAAPETDSDCIVEFENSKGVKMRMQFRKCGDLDFAALSKAFWRNGA